MEYFDGSKITMVAWETRRRRLLDLQHADLQPVKRPDAGDRGVADTLPGLARPAQRLSGRRGRPRTGLARCTLTRTWPPDENRSRSSAPATWDWSRPRALPNSEATSGASTSMPTRSPGSNAARSRSTSPGWPSASPETASVLHFGTELAPALEHARLLFVAVGTPPTYSGDADLSAVYAVVDAMPASDRHALVMKSTVPVGTGAAIKRDVRRARQVAASRTCPAPSSSRRARL